MPNSLQISAERPRPDVAGLSIAVVAGLGLAATALFMFAMPLAGHIAGARDFISYWATGQQIVHHRNPYDREAVALLEHAAGLDSRAVLIMRNPPWALPLAWPLGFIGLRVAAFLWAVLLLGCLLISVQMIRRLQGSPADEARRPIHWLGLAFTPALICLMMGQTALFALLGLVLFLRFQQERPLVAGAALWLCALKPHLFLPIGVVLIAWIFFARAWKVLAGSALALAASVAVSFVLVPGAWPDYIAMLRSPLVENEFIPCLADALRHWTAPQQVWVQYLPVELACLWALAFFWRRRAHWNWIEDGGPLMLVSLLCAPYCWLYDQCLAIPALLGAAYTTRSRALITALSLMILAADIQLCRADMVSPSWLWTAPAWFAWYLFARRASEAKDSEQSPHVAASPAPEAEKRPVGAAGQ